MSSPASPEPGSLAWRITVATLAHRFFSLIHDEETAKLIEQPADAGKAGAWPLAYFDVYLQKIGVPPGSTTAMGRMLDGMERAGLLLRAGWWANMTGVPMRGQLYTSQECDRRRPSAISGYRRRWARATAVAISNGRSHRLAGFRRPSSGRRSRRSLRTICGIRARLWRYRRA